MLSLYSIFSHFGLPEQSEVKLYRHSNHGVRGYNADIEFIYEDQKLEFFQAIQGRHILGNGYLASFIGENGGLSRFVGMWKVMDHIPGGALARTPSDLEFYPYLSESDHWYDLKRDHSFDVLADRLVFKWPEGRASSRWLKNPAGKINDYIIDQIRPRGFAKQFPGFDELILTFRELGQLAKDGDAGGGWLQALSSVRGVYLISDAASGNLYVGSATGAQGIWSRWRAYAQTGHGGNKILRTKLAANELKSEDMVFSILETLSNLSDRRDGLKAEASWKRKLGRKAVVLNAN